MLVPEASLPQDARENVLGIVERAIQALEEPGQPGGDNEIASLCRLEHLVVRLPLPADLRGHAVEALRAVLGTSELNIGDRAGDSSVAVIEGVDGDKPQMRDARLEHRIDALPAIEPA